MTLKVNFKRINRGLWLGAIAIIIVAVSVIIDNYQFKNEQEDIRNVVYDFSVEIVKALESPANIVDGKGKWDEGSIDVAKNEIKAVYDKYWTSTTVSTYGSWFVGLDELKGDVEDMMQHMLTNNGYIKNLKLDYGPALVKSYGPDGAAVTMNVEMEVTYKGMNTLVYGIGSEEDMMYGYDSYYEYIEYDEDGNMVSAVEGKRVDEITEQEFYHSGEITFVLLRENGEWKISGIEYM